MLSDTTAVHGIVKEIKNDVHNLIFISYLIHETLSVSQKDRST